MVSTASGHADDASRSRPAMNRRAFLAAGGGTLLASIGGCLFGSGTPSDSDPTGCQSGVVLQTTPVAPAKVGWRESRSVGELPSSTRYLVRQAADGEVVSLDSTREPPTVDGTVVQVDGTFYRIVEKSDESTAVTGYEYGVRTGEPTRATPPPGETVALADLIRADRTTLRIQLYDPDREVTGGSVGPVVFAYADPATREASAFVPDPEYEHVRYGETVLRFRPAGTKRMTVTPYRIRLERVAESPAAYGEQVLAAGGRRVDPSDLSPEAREFARTAIESSEAEVCSPAPAHVGEVLDAFGLEIGGGDGRYVAYDGEWYEVSVLHYDR